MEKSPVKSPNTPPTPEATANYEGNDALLFLGRIQNSIIKNQVIDLLMEEAHASREAFAADVWEPHLPEGWTGKEKFKLLKNKITGKLTDAETRESILRRPLPTREDFERIIDAKLREAGRKTNIEFSKETPNVSKMTIGWELPHGQRPTAKQMSIAEAHEKGHLIRPYHGLGGRFNRAFDISNVNYTQQDYEATRGNSQLPLEEMRDDYLHNYLFTANEIAERMSQLKNYFGMSGAETFTKEHLHYAREHYIADTGMDNSIRLFFEAITPETEDAFIEIINSAGI